MSVPSNTTKEERENDLMYGRNLQDMPDGMVERQRSMDPINELSSFIDAVAAKPDGVGRVAFESQSHQVDELDAARSQRRASFDVYNSLYDLSALLFNRYLDARRYGLHREVIRDRYDTWLIVSKKCESAKEDYSKDTKNQLSIMDKLSSIIKEQ